tara:strand:- start:241 stop:810 length:570 start_codon:yes stop_codon:yes gene_type:complete
MFIKFFFKVSLVVSFLFLPISKVSAWKTNFVNTIDEDFKSTSRKTAAHKRNISRIPRIKIIVKSNFTLNDLGDGVVAFNHYDNDDLFIQAYDPKEIIFVSSGHHLLQSSEISLKYPNGEVVKANQGLGSSFCDVGNSGIPFCLLKINVVSMGDLPSGKYNLVIGYKSGWKKVHTINILTSYSEFNLDLF